MDSFARRVLLLDDEPLIGEVAGAYLTSVGYDVTVLNGGTAAITAATQRPFDIAVIDIHMAPPDGWTVLAHLRELYPSMPVVVASGIATPSEVAERGGAVLIPKPYGREQLVTTVARLIATAPQPPPP